ncbi:MAG: alpha-L-fucosidase [Kiritimatiellaeota bacterium]|nr:alpha-L-fucosidase [Kiritimatiellota bacterium]
MDAPVSWLPGETAQQRDERMSWWRDAKFGMFINWGLYSIPADNEWHMRLQKKSFAEYSKYAAQFNPVKFNADAWVALGHEAGMKYLVFDCKHHDGFAMFKSAASDYNIVDATPFKRDVMKEISDACPRHDIRFGTYYSFLSDWGDKGGGAGCPKWDPDFQDGDLHEYIKTVALPQLKEILSNYGPSAVMWFDYDGATGITPEESARVVEVLKTQPQIIVDPRLPGVKGDFATAERHLAMRTPKGDWEMCCTLNNVWGYDHSPAKTLKQLLPYLIRAWGQGGNVLLNVGPSPEGIIPEDQVERLREVGAWMKTNGESIYGTTAGPFHYLPWGTATRKGSTVYLQIFDWPADGRLKVPLLNEIKQARLLGSSTNNMLKTSRENGRLIVELPAKAPHAVANVVALEVEGEPKTDYDSVVLNKPVKASANQKEAAFAVDDRDSTSWNTPAPTGWLEMDAGHPVTVATLRIVYFGGTIKSWALEYKDGNEWKPILSGKDLRMGGIIAGNCAVKTFAPVTAQIFRLHILESDKNARISNLELYPPL